MVFMDAETAFANAKTIPTEAPNSAPRVLDMMKYIPPVEIIPIYTSLYLTIRQQSILIGNFFLLFTREFKWK